MEINVGPFKTQSFTKPHKPAPNPPSVPEPSPEHQEPAAHQEGPSVPTLAEVVDQFQRGKIEAGRWNENTVINHRPKLNAMMQVLGHDTPVNRITVEDLREYTKLLELLPKAFTLKGYSDLSGVHSLVRQHTTDQTLIFLKKKSMQFKTAKLANGEVQILAKEQSSANEDGSAELKVQIRRDGTAWVDVDKIKGNRCEKIVADLAQTIGAKASGSLKKEAYYQLPGEPTKINLMI